MRQLFFSFSFWYVTLRENGKGRFLNGELRKIPLWEDTMEPSNRKPNRIPFFDYSQNGAYFVTVCTHERRNIFSDIVGDGFPVPKPCGRIAEEMIHRIPVKYPGVLVDKSVIMPDHIHMLLRIERGSGTGNPSPTQGNIMGWYKYQVTKQINAQFNRQGERVFQRSYYDHVIRNQQDYNEVWEYIENNPRKWVIQNRECL